MSSPGHVCVACVVQALGYIGAVFGGPIAGLISDRMGRKPALMLVSIPYLIGYLMITYARFAVDPEVFKAILLIGRLFSGVGLGWSSLAVVVSSCDGVSVSFPLPVTFGQVSTQ